MAFTEQSLLPHLPDLAGNTRLWVAYSGGMDSHVLLHALVRLTGLGLVNRDNLLALHINHGLSPQADQWQSHCEAVCENLEVALRVQRVQVEAGGGLGPEQAAREARYQVFDSVLGAGDNLLTAHHQDDQLETMLYRLMRGSGPKGLAAIPAERSLRQGRILRPMLGFSREELEVYARGQSLSWIADESNDDRAFDRNYLRHEILPRLRSRWPGMAGSWQRSAELLAEADHLQTILGEQDLAGVRTGHGNRLNIDALLSLDEIRRRNLLRVWFAELHARFQLPQPGYSALQRIIEEVLTAGEDAQPEVTWSARKVRAEVRRYQGELYALKRFEEEAPSGPLSWPVDKVLQLPCQGGRLRFSETQTDGLNLNGIEVLEVGFRQGGESVKPAGRKTRPLKKILQDYGVPPWLRDQVPLVFAGDELIAVGDLFICEAFWLRRRAADGEKRYRLCWEREDIHCGY